LSKGRGKEGRESLEGRRGGISAAKGRFEGAGGRTGTLEGRARRHKNGGGGDRILLKEGKKKRGTLLSTFRGEKRERGFRVDQLKYVLSKGGRGDRKV